MSDFLFFWLKFLFIDSKIYWHFLPMHTRQIYSQTTSSVHASDLDQSILERLTLLIGKKNDQWKSQYVWWIDKCRECVNTESTNLLYIHYNDIPPPCQIYYCIALLYCGIVNLESTISGNIDWIGLKKNNRELRAGEDSIISSFCIGLRYQNYYRII